MFGGEVGRIAGSGVGGERQAGCGRPFYVTSTTAITRQTTHQYPNHCTETAAATGDYMPNDLLLVTDKTPL